MHPMHKECLKTAFIYNSIFITIILIGFLFRFLHLYTLGNSILLIMIFIYSICFVCTMMFILEVLGSDYRPTISSNGQEKWIEL